ncbi:MAG TPA: peptide-methionine (S)-S-oxide reductase MsrA [Candidatus Sulfotelmatobacter sp.]|nr:peptide-methionine (S)-S-oxide reductase MsrA [Candidatus Sulfotelmatobacter sp.]
MRLTRVFASPLVIVAVLGVFSAVALADTNPTTRVEKATAAQPASAAPASVKPETAIFAGGCFWSMEVQFESRPGVLSVVSGYSGGHTSNPTYEEVGSGMTGHKESVEVKFDPSKITYEQLLDIYWHGIDPTQSDGQFCDRGDEYTSVVFYRDEAQHQAALASKAGIEKSGVLKRPIVTEIRKAGPFYPAEDYHQDFWKKSWDHYHAYRVGCGRDRQLQAVWGKLAVLPVAYSQTSASH